MPWNLILSFLRANWRGTAIVCLGVLLTLSLTFHRRLSVKYKDREKEWELQLAQAQAQANKQKKEYDHALVVADARTVALVEQAKKSAWKAYTARATANVAAGLDPARFASMLDLPTRATPGAAEAERAPDPDGASPERLAPDRAFVADCALDAARLTGWQSWARELNLPVKE